MPVAARERNSFLVAAGLAYFSGVHARRSFPHFLSRLLRPLLAKETLVAIIFTAACALPTLGRTAAGSVHFALPLGRLMVAVFYFALLASLNCHSIERWESDQNAFDGNLSSRSGTFAQGVGLAVAGLVLAGILSSNHRIAFLVGSGAAAALLLALLDQFRGRLTPLALRVAADLVLLTPLPFLFQ
jgi:hypothetical protein